MIALCYDETAAQDYSTGASMQIEDMENVGFAGAPVYSVYVVWSGEIEYGPRYTDTAG